MIGLSSAPGEAAAAPHTLVSGVDAKVSLGAEALMVVPAVPARGEGQRGTRPIHGGAPAVSSQASVAHVGCGGGASHLLYKL